MDAWVGPAIVAAIISGLVSLILVQLNFQQGRKIERLRREEKIRDFQIALRAEIRSDLANLSRFDLDGVLLQMERRYAEEPDFSVSVPRVPRHIVFEAIVGEIHILPEAVIGPVVLYVRQRHAVESLTEDMRDPMFRSLSKERQLSMYRDYLGMWKHWRALAEQAEKVLSVGAVQ